MASSKTINRTDAQLPLDPLLKHGIYGAGIAFCDTLAMLTIGLVWPVGSVGITDSNRALRFAKAKPSAFPRFAEEI